MIEWHDAPTRRPAVYADHAGVRLFVQETVRSDRAHAMIGGREYAAHVSGLRVGEFGELALAKAAALDAAQTKTAPRGCRAVIAVMGRGRRTSLDARASE